MESTSASNVSVIEGSLVESSLNTFEEEDAINAEGAESDIDINESSITLPRPPTQPNVPIIDKTICPVCKVAGK